jgi:coproporphyrinogen III oxidase-like Fe-S oxidoreductase
VRRPHRWRTAVGEHGIAVDGEERLSVAQARSDFVITGLRRIAGVDVGEFERRFAIAVRAAFPQLTHLERDDLVVLSGTTLRLTARGLRFADTVGACLV